MVPALCALNSNMTELSSTGWAQFLEQYPDAHLLQTPAWGELKAAFGWQVSRVSNGAVGAQILFRPLLFGLTIAYIPKGPVGPQEEAERCWEQFWPAVDEVSRQYRAVLLKVEPDLWEGKLQKPGVQKAPPGFRLSPHSIQPPRTLVIDLTGEDEQILARMKQKTRYNIRLAQKKGVVVRATQDIGTFHRLMEITGRRDGFGVHSREYYARAYELFHPSGMCELLLAEFEGQPLAGLMVFANGKRAWYLHGASSSDHRERMPTYLLQWEAMRWARSRGCSQYDLWGVPDADEPDLEAGFTGRSDGLWGVYRFKRGFGGWLLRAAGPWDRVYNSMIYRLYQVWLGRRASGAG